MQMIINRKFHKIHFQAINLFYYQAPKLKFLSQEKI